MGPTGRRVLSSALLALLVAALVVPVALFHRDIWAVVSTKAALKAWIEGWGPWAGAAYAAVQALQVIVFVIPGELVQVGGGYIFGWLPGALLAIAGTVAGATVSFFAARLLGRPFVGAFVAPSRLAQVEKLLATRNARIVFFLLYLIPGIPKDVLGYAAGVSPLRFWWFIGVSMLGRLPALVGSAIIGAALARSQWVLFGVLGGGAAALFAAGVLLRPRIQAWLDRLAERRGRAGRAGRGGTGATPS